MISARRLAREWALKILYQSDVGKMAIAESQAAALERVRLEFVQRASRTAHGSLLEEQLASAVTAELRELLPQYDASTETMLRECFARIADAADCWSQFEINLSVSRQSFNALWEIPNRQSPFALPVSSRSVPVDVLSTQNLDASQLSRLEQFLGWACNSLPAVAMAAYAGEIRLGRPAGAKLAETHDYVVNQWRSFGESMTERWRPAVLSVEKQSCDWMRVAAFTLTLVEGVSEHREAIDRSLESLEIGWSLDRQVSVDRNIMRMAAFELRYLDSIPVNATINEAVELAKKYSTAESGKFVNGILGAIVAARAKDSQAADPEDCIIELQSEDIDLLAESDEAVLEELAHA